MSSKAFNKMMKQFLVELKAAFPDDESIASYRETFDAARKTFPNLPLTKFREDVMPLAELVEANDPVFFEKFPLKAVDLPALWAKASENTKECIWEYIQALYDIAKNADLESVDEGQDMMKAVETALSAPKPASTRKRGGPGARGAGAGVSGLNLDPLMGLMTQVMANIDMEQISAVASSMGLMDPVTKQPNMAKVAEIMGSVPSLIDGLSGIMPPGASKP